jgi:hypothetical protein
MTTDDALSRSSCDMAPWLPLSEMTILERDSTLRMSD